MSSDTTSTAGKEDNNFWRAVFKTADDVIFSIDPADGKRREASNRRVSRFGFSFHEDTINRIIGDHRPNSPHAARIEFKRSLTEMIEGKK